MKARYVVIVVLLIEFLVAATAYVTYKRSDKEWLGTPIINKEIHSLLNDNVEYKPLPAYSIEFGLRGDGTVIWRRK